MSLTITNITQASSAVVTVNATGSNPFATGNLVAFAAVVGMTQINGTNGTVIAIGGSSGAYTATFNINSTSYTAYSSGGTATILTGVPISGLPTGGAIGNTDVFPWSQGSTTIKQPATALLQYINPITSAEIAAGVTPTNYAYPPGHILRYGTNTTPGTTNMTAAFAALALTGYVGYAPAQDYLISSTITWSVNNSGLRGDGIGTRILTNSATADVFALGNGSTTIQGLLFKDFGIWSTITKTAGNAFNCQYISEANFYNVYAGAQEYYANDSNTNRLWNGFAFNHFNICQIIGGQTYFQNFGIQANGDSTDTQFGDELTVTAGHIMLGGGTVGTSKAVYLSGNAGGVYLDRVSISGIVGYGVYTDNTATSATYPNRELFLTASCVIDSCTNWGVYIASDSLAYFEASGAWICGNGTAISGTGGMVVNPFVSGTTPEVKIVGCRIAYNNYDGLVLNDGAFQITGNVIANNGPASQGGYGVFIAATAATPLVLNSNYIADNGNSSRGYGVYIASGSQTNFNIQSNTLYGNGQTAQIYDPAANSTTAIIRGNAGYVTENNGAVSVATGATVAHGLATTPSQVLVQQTSGTPSAVYVSSVGATTFVINFTGGGTQGFQWRAVIGSQ